MTKFIGMNCIAHPVVLLPFVFPPGRVMIYQADRICVGYFSYYIHVFVEVWFALQSGLGQYGTCRLQYWDPAKDEDFFNEKSNIPFEFIWWHISIGTVVHSEHDEYDMRIELPDKSVIIF